MEQSLKVSKINTVYEYTEVYSERPFKMDDAKMALAAIAGSAVLHHMLSAAISRNPLTITRDGATMQAVGHVSSVNIHPVKSARRLAVNAAYCGVTGMCTEDERLFDR